MKIPDGLTIGSRAVIDEAIPVHAGRGGTILDAKWYMAMGLWMVSVRLDGRKTAFWVPLPSVTIVQPPMPASEDEDQ